MDKQSFFAKAIPAALASGHVFPDYAACEAALESAWGDSKLAREANNLFGQKAGFSTEQFDTVEIPTREYLNNEWVTVPAKWPKFPDWEWSFRMRMTLLHRSQLYAEALKATTGEDFVREVSKHWSTDPDRAQKVLNTYRANVQLIQNAMNMAQAAKEQA